jgi:UPF0755 protein
MAFMLIKPLGRILTGLVVLFLLGVLWFALQVFPVGGSGREVIIDVTPGSSIATIAGQLHEKGVIASPFAFRIDTLIFGAPTVQSGTYELKQGSSFAAVKSILGSYPNVRAVVVLPGLTLHEVALDVASDTSGTFGARFMSDATAAATQSPFKPDGSLEGLIGSGTYIIRPGETAGELVTAMTKSFVKEASASGLTPATTLNGLDAYQLITAASIVEKEGYYPSNMPKVARVIFNRLAQGGRLQMDSTVLYYLGKDGGAVTPAMLALNTPYNTYIQIGLTPTPICTVSSYALNAVLHAPKGTWYYFTLVNKDGTMRFSTTWAEQLAAERLAASRGIG